MAVVGSKSKSKTSDVTKDRTCVLILGMHRSGTSALAGVLSKLGCELPASPMPESKSNAKGFFESIKVRDFNEELLASAGSFWDDFTRFHDDWLKSLPGLDFLDRAVSVLEEEFGTSRLFVLKDPRICRLMPFWMEALGRFECRVKPILTIRNPLEVGHSLQTKKNYPEPLSEMIWLRHALDAEAATRGMLRFHTSFEQLMLGWETVAAKAQDSLHLVWPRSVANIEFDVQRFLSDDLRHSKEAPTKVLNSALLPHWLRETYEIFGRWAESGEVETDHPNLDRIKADFDVASSAFARLVRAERNSSLEYRLRMEELQAANSARESELHAIASEAVEQRKALSRSLEGEKAAREKQLTALASERAERSAIEAKLSAIVTEAKQQRAIFETKLEEQKSVDDAERKAIEARAAALVLEAKAERDALQSQVSDLTKSLQEERRQKTLMNAELQKRLEVQEQLSAELAASQARRKEAARVIARRDAEIQIRYEELAALERHILHSSISWKVGQLLRRLNRAARRPLRKKAYS